jgi:hypothetical protein
VRSPTTARQKGKQVSMPRQPREGRVEPSRPRQLPHYGLPGKTPQAREAPPASGVPGPDRRLMRFSLEVYLRPSRPSWTGSHLLPSRRGCFFAIARAFAGTKRLRESKRAVGSDWLIWIRGSKNSENFLAMKHLPRDPIHRSKEGLIRSQGDPEPPDLRRTAGIPAC